MNLLIIIFLVLFRSACCLDFDFCRMWSKNMYFLVTKHDPFSYEIPLVIPDRLHTPSFVGTVIGKNQILSVDAPALCAYLDKFECFDESSGQPADHFMRKLNSRAEFGKGGRTIIDKWNEDGPKGRISGSAQIKTDGLLKSYRIIAVTHNEIVVQGVHKEFKPGMPLTKNGKLLGIGKSIDAAARTITFAKATEQTLRDAPRTSLRDAEEGTVTPRNSLYTTETRSSAGYNYN